MKAAEILIFDGRPSIGRAMGFDSQPEPSCTILSITGSFVSTEAFCMFLHIL